MTDVHRLPDALESEREASEWIARLEADDLSAEERLRFQQWLSAHPMNARAYEALRATWTELTQARSLVRAVSFGQAMIEAGKPRRTAWRWPLAAAASVAIAVIGGAWYHSRLLPPQHFQTALGERTTVTLGDRSMVELNTDTSVRVEYSRRVRIVHLERGEAFFRVSHDPARPFWVMADGSWVRAVGTAFNVDIRPENAGVRVTVSEGTVKVGSALPERVPLAVQLADAPATMISAGEQVDVHGRDVLVRKLNAAQIRRSTAWRTGTLLFQNQPLGDVVAELERYSTLRLIIDDPALARLPIGGSFQANLQGIDTLLDMLQGGFGLAVHRQGNSVHIDSRRLEQQHQHE